MWKNIYQNSKRYVSYCLVALGLICFKIDLIQANPNELVSSFDRAIAGAVLDETGEPIPGVSVLLVGTSRGTVTDLDGRFEITVPDERGSLQFSFIGFITQRIEIANQNEINITLNQDLSSLEEVVVVGYGTQRKKDLTGAVASADIEAFRESPNVNIMQSLQGSVPGVQIGQTNQAGQEPAIAIRGQTTISGNTSPLIVLDGMIFRGRLADINPGDIQSIDILKDASSMAIYGAQAANGVILITSKSGKTARKPTLTYSGSVSTQTPTINARLLNRDEVLEKVRDVEYRNAFLAPDYTQPNPDWDFDNSELLPPLSRGVEDGTNYDWWDGLTSPGYISNHQLSISGGSENISYYISAGNTEQKGFVLNDDFKRTTVRINLETDINDWLTIGVNSFGSFSDHSGVFPNMGQLGRTSPLVTPFDENGNLAVNHLGDNVVNPFLNAQADDRELKNRLSGVFYGLIKVPNVEGLTYRVNFSNNLNWFEDARSNPYDAGLTGAAFKAHARNLDVMLDNIVSYDRRFNDHGINATFLYGFNQITFNRTYAGGQNIPNLALSYNSLQQAIIREIESNAWEESLLYQMGRVNYSYKDKYMLTGTLRRDGFSGFSRNNKFALFPSIGAGWILSDENFLEGKMDLLKLRASYGQNGNQTGRYSSLARVSTTDASRYVFGDGGPSSPGQSVASLANDDLSWEKTVGLNIGVDFGLLNSKLTGNIEYYSTTTTDLLWNMIIPRMTGFNQIATNLGEVANTGLEFALQANPIQTNDFSWNVSVNFGTNNNRIVTLLGEDKDGDGVEDDLIASGLFIGKSLGAIFNYQIDGIWQVEDDIPSGFSPGNYRIRDQNGDGMITPEDDRVFLGRTEPAYLMGMQNTMRYKNFTFRFFINSIQGGRDRYLGANTTAGIPGTTGTAQNANWFTFYDYWSPRNPDARYNIPWVPGQVNPPRYFSRSFVRLQDISLAYQFQDKLINRLGIQNLKLFVSGKNLLTFTDWDGWDPETGQGIGASNAFPVMKAYTLGVDVSF